MTRSPRKAAVRKRRSYPVAQHNEWIRPIRKGYRMRCCDCGLVHELDFAIIRHGSGRKVIFRARRNERATAAIRRAKRAKGGKSS